MNGNEENKDLREQYLFSGLKFILGIIVTVVLGTVIAKALRPLYTEAVILMAPDKWCEVNGESDVIPIVQDNSDCIEVYFTNNNDYLIRIEDIAVNVYDYEEVSEYTLRDDIGGHGDLEEAIFLSAAISPGEKRSDVVLQDGSGSKKFLTLEGNTGDKYIIVPDISEEGIYEFDVEFKYRYLGRTYKVSTEKVKILYEKTDSEAEPETRLRGDSEAEPEIHLRGDSEAEPEIRLQGEFDWWSGYIEILKNVNQYFTVEDMTYIELKDMDGDEIPELHMVTAVGSHGLLTTTKIYYYDNGKLECIVGDYGGVESYPPEYYVNSETGEKSWIIGWYEGVFELETLFYNGADIRKVSIENGELRMESLVKVTGSKYTGIAPTSFYAFGREYSDMNEFKQAVDAEWKWVCTDKLENYLLWTPGTSRFGIEEIADFLNAYAE